MASPQTTPKRPSRCALRLVDGHSTPPRSRVESCGPSGSQDSTLSWTASAQSALSTWVEMREDGSPGTFRGRHSQRGGRPTAEFAQPLVAAPERAAHKLRRDVGLVGLVFASFGSIIGAGWLFAAQYASSLAGPAAIISWLIGGSAMMLLALTHAELGGMYPVAGGSARFPQYAFGSLIGFTGGWVTFLGAVTVAPIMVQATLLYASNYISSLMTITDGRPVLTAQGYVVAGTLLLLFCTINVMGVRWLAETNKLVVWWKLLIPAV